MPDEIGFEPTIRELFSERDQKAMRGYFDLWEVEDVRRHSAAILRNVESGRMPCNSFWAKDKVALLRSWIDAGMPA